MKKIKCILGLHEVDNNQEVKKLFFPISKDWEYVEYRFWCRNCGAYCFSGDKEDAKFRVWLSAASLLLLFVIVGLHYV